MLKFTLYGPQAVIAGLKKSWWAKWNCGYRIHTDGSGLFKNTFKSIQQRGGAVTSVDLNVYY
jgi:hypothetical protein